MKQKEYERSEESEWTVAVHKAPVRPAVQKDLSQYRAAKEGQGSVLAFATTKWEDEPVRALTRPAKSDSGRLLLPLEAALSPDPSARQVMHHTTLHYSTQCVDE